MQAEATLRLFSDRNTSREHRQHLETVTSALTQLAYDCSIWVDPKWHLLGCRFNFPMHLSMFGGLSDCMEMVRIQATLHAARRQTCMVVRAYIHCQTGLHARLLAWGHA
jgi:hypothetical protein